MTTSRFGRIVRVLGFVLLVAVGVLVWVSGLIMPAQAVIALGVLWVVGVLVAIRWRRRPELVLVVPLAVAAIWFLTAWIGETIWGWTA